MYAVSALMQAILLVMCFIWKIRQRRLGIDDFGHPIVSSRPDGPLLVETDDRQPIEQALQDAVDEEAPGVHNSLISANESTPLLHGKTSRDDSPEARPRKSWFSLSRS